jgi:plastocyanin
VSVRPARLSAALLGALCALAVGGCAGTDASGSPAGSSAAAPSSSTTASATTSASPDKASVRVELDIAAGQVSGNPGRVPVRAGESVTLVLTSDVADEVHVHGYDLTADLAPGQPAELTFDATIPGVFEVELHDAGTVLLTLQVE